MNISDIRAGLRTLVENEETTFKQIALESGLSTGTISSFINDKYNGDILFRQWYSHAPGI